MDKDAFADVVIVLDAAVVTASLQGVVMLAEEMHRLPLYAAQLIPTPVLSYHNQSLPLLMAGRLFMTGSVTSLQRMCASLVAPTSREACNQQWRTSTKSRKRLHDENASPTASWKHAAGE
jgi:hypothetical protein